MPCPEVGEYQAGCLSSQTLNLVLIDLGAFWGVLDDLPFLRFRKSGIIVKRKEPMDPTGLWFFY